MHPGARARSPPRSSPGRPDGRDRGTSHSGRDIRLEIDGGVKVNNIREIAEAGADTFVAGSAIFQTEDYKATIDLMRKELAQVS